MTELKYWQGRHVLVQAQIPGTTNMIVKVLADMRLNTQTNEVGCEFQAKAKDIEPLIKDVFPLHAHVKNKYGSMIGKISAYELATNKAVVISDKIENYQNKSTRYTYTQHELELYNADAIVLAPGCWYRTNHRNDYLAVQSVFEQDEIMLFDREGNMVFTGLKKENLKSMLYAKHGIHHIEKRGSL